MAATIEMQSNYSRAEGRRTRPMVDSALRHRPRAHFEYSYALFKKSLDVVLFGLVGERLREKGATTTWSMGVAALGKGKDSGWGSGLDGG